MTKYSHEVRIKAAKDYCRGGRGLREVARRHGVNVASLRLWVATYRIHGARGVRSKTRNVYSAEFKLAVLQRMRTESLSRRQAAALFNVRRHDMIGIWQRAYDSGGIAALRSTADRRRESTMEESEGERPGKNRIDDQRSRKELLEELQHLRMENAYLKKLKALAQSDSPAHESGPEPCKS